MKKILAIIVLISLALGVPENKAHKVLSKTTFTISGTSTLHDWTMESQQAKGEGIFLVEDGKLEGIERLRISLQAESLKSGKSAMDNNAYSSLGTKKHPYIVFELNNIEGLNQAAASGKINAYGKVTIAGFSRPEELVVTYKTDRQGNIQFEGSKDIKMSNYKVEPPSFMMGTVKTGDEVKVNFSIQFKDGSNS